jgi:hypothetical protein
MSPAGLRISSVTRTYVHNVSPKSVALQGFGKSEPSKHWDDGLTIGERKSDKRLQTWTLLNKEAECHLVPLSLCRAPFYPSLTLEQWVIRQEMYSVQELD